MFMPTLKNKSVLITGAASGIGLACAKAYAQQGARIVLTDINATALETAKTEIAAMGVACIALVCDVGKVESINACADAVHKEWGTLDVLVNNAGIYYLGGFMETDPVMWQRFYDINVMSVVHMCRAFLPAMKTAPGPHRIVNIASLSSFLPAPNISAYATSKHAVLGLSEVLAMELVGSNVGVTVVCPGIINTPLLGGGRNVGANITERQLKMQADYYQQHGCPPSEVADGIVRATLAGEDYCFTGPKAKLGYNVTRISRTLARKISVRNARSNGYLDPDA
jgi:NAD(P)-dependent dehydrogenase (short-subunit alcohol dehydrogenase family)